MSNSADDDAFHQARTDTITDPVDFRTIQIMGVSYLIFTILLLYVLVSIWPVPEIVAGGTATNFKGFKLFALECYMEPDHQVLAMVGAAGALGSLTHVLTSFGDFVGNKKLGVSWIWWLILRIPIGMALALLLYLIVRGGLLVPNTQAMGDAAGKPNYNATLGINLYSIAAFSALAGMFSKQATDKFGEVFTAVFSMKKEVERDGALDTTGWTVNPEKLTVGKPQPLVVIGAGFSSETTATIGGEKRSFKPDSAIKGTVTPEAADVKAPGFIELIITNRGKTFTKRLEVVAADAPPAAGVKPSISGTAPPNLTAASARTIDVIGEGLTGSSATINGEARTVTPGDDRKITVALDDKDFQNGPGVLDLIVTTSNGNAQQKIEIVA